MTLVQKPINGTEYYTDDQVYYTFYQVKNATDTLWDFACMDLGITKKIGFTSQELKNITDLAGIGPRYPTRFLLLRDGNAVPVPYLVNGSANLQLNDLILRSVAVPTLSKPIVPHPALTNNVVDRLKEIKDLYNRKLITDSEYQDKRAKIIAEL